MKFFVRMSFVILLGSLNPTPGNCDDFSWAMFLPAITGSGGSKVNCGNIAGCYDGLFTDDCPGTSVSGRINISINEDCSFRSFSNYGVQTNGKITNHSGLTYSGSGQSDSSGCGTFNISCTDNGTSLACNYRYSSGAVGAIPNAVAGACKSANRLKTEMLAGYWRYAFQIVSIFNYYYYLDINEVEASTASPGDYNIYGTNEYGDLIVAAYNASYDDYSLYDPGTIIDKFYVFDFTGGGVVSGCYYQIDNSDNSWSSCYPMSGVLLGLTKTESVAKADIQLSQNERESQSEREIRELESQDITPKSNEIDHYVLKSYEQLKAIYSSRQ